MPIGNPISAVDEFRLSMSYYYKAQRDRADRCLADIIDILGNSDSEEQQIKTLLERLAAHYAPTEVALPPVASPGWRANSPGWRANAAEMSAKRD